MNVLIYADDHLGPCAAASLPGGEDPPHPEWYAPSPQVPAYARSLFYGKGHAISWEAWADHLARSSRYGGSWRVIGVPDAWGGRPDGLRLALAQAQQAAQL